MDYAEWLRAERQQKDLFFRVSPHSPIPEPRAAFAGLRYFDPDPAYRVEARVERPKERRTVRIGTSTGEVREYEDAAILRFRLAGQDVSLHGFAGGGHHDALFIPFRDATSGKETYGAGRYLDVPWSGGAMLVLDLNLAYNPYCAYDEAYSCPVPPRENWLPVPVRAGEMAYKDEA